MKYFLILLFSLSFSAQALDFEASLGKSGNSSGPAYSIGVTGLIAEGWRFHAGWANLGTQNLDVNTATEVSGYDEIMAGRYSPPLHWIKTRPVKELFVTVDPEWKIGQLTYALEVGVAAYHPMMQEDLAVGEAAPAEDGRINYTGILGASIGYGNTSVVISRQLITEYRDWLNGSPSSKMVTLSIRQRF